MKKLNTTVLAGALAGVLLPGLAAAQGTRELGAARAFEIQLATANDLAPTRTGQDGVKRLRMTDEEFTNEQAAVRFTADGRTALLVRMQTSEINPGTPQASLPPNRMQCAVSILETYQEADGSVAVRRPTGLADFWLTNNRGNEYRNCNKPEVLAINGGKAFMVTYNYQPEGQSDTKRYAKVVRRDGTIVPLRNANGQLQNQVIVMAKNNDDCAGAQDGAGKGGIPYYDEGATTRYAGWALCNGNGRDDGWLYSIESKCTVDAAGEPTECTIKRLFDISLAQREERTRGRCTIGGADKSFAVCTWSEGNTQPTYEGTWIAAVDLSTAGQNAENAQGRLLWKDRLNHKQTITINGQPRETYAMRANHTRLLTKAADGSLQPSDEIFFTDTAHVGRNTNDEKGGRWLAANMAVIKATRTDYTFSMPMTTIDVSKSPMLLGLDGTHLAVVEGIYGKGDQLVSGFSMLQGSQTGGLQQDADIRTIAYNPTTKSMTNLGQHNAAAPYDRHLYSNYLGNNPGNQGRNFSGADVVKNPFVGINGNQVAYFTAFALTGKASSQPGSEYKPSVYLSLFPTAFTADAPDPGAGYNDDLPGDETPDAPAPQEPDPITPEDPGTSVGGCSTSSPSTGGLFLFGLALAFVVRRRRNRN